MNASKRYQYLQHLPQPLLDRIADGHCVPIIGAGFSKNAKLPQESRMLGWDDVAEDLARDLQVAAGSALQAFSGVLPKPAPSDGSYPYASKVDPLDVISGYEAKFSRSTLIERFRHLILIDEAEPGPAHLAFAALSFKAVITTNYDCLLEDAYQRIGKSVSIVVSESEAQVHDPDTATIELLKIHGDFHHPDRLVMTRGDYDGFYWSHRSIYGEILRLFFPSALCLIGYGARDPDYQHIQQFVQGALIKFTSKWQKAMKRPVDFWHRVYRIVLDPEDPASQSILIPREGKSHGEVLTKLFEEIGQWLSDRTQVSGESC